jgi:hypothetical protein
MKIREDILTLIPSNSVCVEIGVFEGNFSKIILSVNPKELYLVDLFEGPMCSGDKNGENMRYIELENSYKKLQEEYKLNKRKKGKFLQTEESLLQLSQNLQNAEVAHRDGDIDLSLKTYTDVAH